MFSVFSGVWLFLDGFRWVFGSFKLGLGVLGCFWMFSEVFGVTGYFYVLPEGWVCLVFSRQETFLRIWFLFCIFAFAWTTATCCDLNLQLIAFTADIWVRIKPVVLQNAAVYFSSPPAKQQTRNSSAAILLQKLLRAEPSRAGGLRSDRDGYSGRGSALRYR